MRLVMTSDLHGSLPYVPQCDLFLCAGDLCPIENHSLYFQAEWLERTFVPWLAQVPARKKVFIAGNHDFVMAHAPEMIAHIEWPGSYLEDSGCEWEGIHIWGSPWANEIVGWPFTAPEDVLNGFWQQIPTSTRILLVHGPPHGLGDQVIGNISGDVLHVGSRSLLQRINALPNLRLVVHGHIHEGAGVYEQNEVVLVNASLMSEAYQPVQPLRVMDLSFEEMTGL